MRVPAEDMEPAPLGWGAVLFPPWVSTCVPALLPPRCLLPLSLSVSSLCHAPLSPVSLPVSLFLSDSVLRAHTLLPPSPLSTPPLPWDSQQDAIRGCYLADSAQGMQILHGNQGSVQQLESGSL